MPYSFSLAIEYGDLVVGHVRIVVLDQRVGRRGIAVEVAVPAFDRGLDEALHPVRMVLVTSFQLVSIVVE